MHISGKIVPRQQSKKFQTSLSNHTLPLCKFLSVFQQHGGFPSSATNFLLSSFQLGEQTSGFHACANVSQAMAGYAAATTALKM